VSIKVVYNACYGGFSLSKAAVEWLVARGCPEAIAYVAQVEKWSAADEHARVFYNRFDYWSSPGIKRHDGLLVECVESLGDAAGGQFATLKIATIRGNRYRIEEYDGNESVVEPDEVEWVEAP